MAQIKTAAYSSSVDMVLGHPYPLRKVLSLHPTTHWGLGGPWTSPQSDLVPVFQTSTHVEGTIEATPYAGCLHLRDGKS